MLQSLTHKQLQREATTRLNEFMDILRNQPSADLSAKNLGEEGCAYIAEALAFNDRCEIFHVVLSHDKFDGRPLLSKYATDCKWGVVAQKD